jgi:hypothetical protein
MCYIVHLQPREWSSPRAGAGDQGRRASQSQQRRRQVSPGNSDNNNNNGREGWRRRQQQEAAGAGCAAGGVSVQPEERARVALQPADDGGLRPLPVPPRQGPDAERGGCRRRTRRRGAARPHREREESTRRGGRGHGHHHRHRRAAQGRRRAAGERAALLGARIAWLLAGGDRWDRKILGHRGGVAHIIWWRLNSSLRSHSNLANAVVPYPVRKSFCGGLCSSFIPSLISSMLLAYMRLRLAIAPPVAVVEVHSCDSIATVAGAAFACGSWCISHCAFAGALYFSLKKYIF